MRAPQERERTMRDLYDRTLHKDLALLEESAKERRRGGGGRAEGSEQHEVVPKMEDNPTVRKRPVPCDSPRAKAESGTCNLCSAPCSSCLHRNLAPVDSNMDCGSSQTCCARSESKGSMLIRSGKGLHSKGGENEDEFSATSSHASYSENGGHKAMARSLVGADSEVDMPAKRRRLLNHDPRSPREECHDDSNSCVTGTSAASKLLLDKKDKLSTSASSRDLTVKDYKDKNIACHNKLRNSLVEESTEKKGSDVHIMQPCSFDRSVPADSPSVATKKLLRTQSSASASQGLSLKRLGQGLADSQDDLAQKTYEKVSNDNIDKSVGEKLNPSVIGGDKHGMRSTSNRNTIKAGSSSKELESVTPCSRNSSQEHAEIESVHVAKSNNNVKEDQNQDLSMDISSGRELNTQNDATTECGNSESLVDVNVCDTCGDVGREYLLATCTRCLEGAEHTYCMKVKLDKVPDGEWLCEECQLNEARIKTRSNHGASTVDILNGKNQNAESMGNPKTLQIAVTNLESQQIARGTPITNHLPCNDKKLHSTSIDPEARQVKCATPTAERLDSKNKNRSMANRKRLQVATSDTEARPPACGTPTGGRLGKKIESSEDLLNRKKLRIATDIESPLSSEGLLSPPKSCKRQAENASSSDARLFKTESPRKHDIFSRQNSFKKSDKGNFKSPNNAPVRGVQEVKSSATLSRSYSSGSMANVKAPPVPSPRGPLSKQMSFNNANSEPKVKQLVEGVSSKLKPVKHSLIEIGEKGPLRKLIKHESFKREGSVCKDSSSIKQKQSLLLSRDENPRMLKQMKDRSFLERRGSFNLQKPNIPSSPRPDCSMKSGERKIDQDNPRPGPSILKTSKTGSIEKKQSFGLSKKEKGDITVPPTLDGVLSAKDASTMKTSYPQLPVENVNKDSDCVVEASFISLKNDEEMQTKPEALSTPLTMTSESDLQDMVPRASALEDLTPVGHRQQDILVSTGNKSSKSAELIQASEDKLPESPHGPVMAHKLCGPESLMAQNLCAPESKLIEPNLKHHDSSDELPAIGNLSRALVFPEQIYIWQGIFEVSRPGNSCEIFDGIQAHLSTSVSPKALDVVKQLPQIIQLVEVPRWPQQFKEVQPNEDNIALFFFAKDVESYDRSYGKLLEKMLVGDFSLTANISGFELLILSSDKLPEKIQRWNGLLYFWGVFYAGKANSSTEHIRVTNPSPVESISGPTDKPACSPKVPQSLGIDLNECPGDEFYDQPVSLGSEIEKFGSSEDNQTLFRSKHEYENLDAREVHHEGTAATREILLGSATAGVCETYIPTSSGGCNMKPDYPSVTKGGTGTAGRDVMEDKDSFSPNKAQRDVEQHACAGRLTSGDILAKKQALTSLTEVSVRHSSESISKADFVMRDSVSNYKRQKTSHGDEQLPSKCLSKMHSLPASWHASPDDIQYTYRGLPDLGSTTKTVSDHVVHVLSSDDEDSPEPSTTMNKASLKAEGSSSLLSLSLSTVAKTHNLVGSVTGDDRSLSLSLGLPLPGVAKGKQDLEIKQFLPEKPGINTSFLL